MAAASSEIGPSAAGPGASPTGVLIVDKPLRTTSMHVCRVVKRRLINGGAPKRVKVGHGGTLDPLATGVLVVLVGKATKRCDQVMAGRKRYVAEVDLSHRSTTDDAEGELTDTPVERPPSREDVERALAGFVGTIMQRPPAYSAIKVGGRRAYQLARKHERAEARRHEGGGDEATERPTDSGGGLPVLEVRPVVVHSVELAEYAWPRAVVEIACGKGTYIRSIARDLGEALGTGGMLTGLRRTEVAPYGIGEAVKLEDVPDPLTAEAWKTVAALTDG
jgi:tRNA pseudouridine55 synthase